MNTFGRRDRLVTNIANAVLHLGSSECQDRIRGLIQRGVEEEQADEKRVFDAKFYEDKPW